MAQKRIEIKRKHSDSIHQPTPFWAYLLIGIGAIWLLGNIGLFDGIGRLWPLVLVVIGLYMLFGRSFPGAAARTEYFSEPTDGATAANVQLGLSVGETNIHALTDSNANLIDAEITHVGEVDFVVSGEGEKTIELRQNTRSFGAFLNPAGWLNGDNQNLRWNIGLNPNVPLALDVRGAVGKSQLDLYRLNLTALNISTGVGSMDITLPSKSMLDAARINGGVGQINVEVPDGTDLRADVQAGTGELRLNFGRDTSGILDINGGLGEIEVRVPLDAAVRVEASGGLGDVNVPARMLRVTDASDGFGNKRGVWQTPNFERAERHIILHCNMGVGELTVR